MGFMAFGIGFCAMGIGLYATVAACCALLSFVRDYRRD
jgi:hypothetical protein